MYEVTIYWPTRTVVYVGTYEQVVQARADAITSGHAVSGIRPKSTIL